MTRHVSAFVDIRNVADETYVSNVQPAVAATPGPVGYYWPGDGRAVYGGLTAHVLARAATDAWSPLRIRQLAA